MANQTFYTAFLAHPSEVKNVRRNAEAGAASGSSNSGPDLFVCFDTFAYSAVFWLIDKRSNSNFAPFAYSAVFALFALCTLHHFASPAPLSPNQYPEPPSGHQSHRLFDSPGVRAFLAANGNKDVRPTLRPLFQ